VIERRGVPRRGGVAITAIGRGKNRPSARVRGIVRLLPGCQVAAGISAVRWRNHQVIVVPDVARKAGHVGVALRQQESCGGVIKLGVQPTVEGMAHIAGGGKHRGVGQVRRIIGLLVVGQVAGNAFRR